eukprot:2026834-Ditylum_brightwellii.AAC.1
MDRLHAMLTTLQQACGSTAITLTTLMVQNDERELLFLKQRCNQQWYRGGAPSMGFTSVLGWSSAR